MKTQSELARLLELSDDDLYIVLARDAGLLGLGIRPPSLRSLRAAGKTWVRDKLPELKKSLCKNAALRRLVQSPPGKENRLHIALAVAEIIAHQAGIQPGVAPLAVLLTKSGIENVCAECWRDGH